MVYNNIHIRLVLSWVAQNQQTNVSSQRGGGARLDTRRDDLSLAEQNSHKNNAGKLPSTHRILRLWTCAVTVVFERNRRLGWMWVH